MPLPLSAEQRSAGLAVLSDAEANRYDAAPSEGFLGGRLLIRTLLAELTGLAPTEVFLHAPCVDCSRQHGRVTAPDTEFHLSVTHSESAVVIAASDVPVGIDTEHDPSPEALAAIGVVAGEASLSRWTRVEAVLKADGRGLTVDPRRVVFQDDLGWVDDRPDRYKLSEVELAPGVLVSVASLFRSN